MLEGSREAVTEEGILYFPGLDRHAEDIVSGCGKCQIVVKNDMRYLLNPAKIPGEPYERVTSDH